MHEIAFHYLFEAAPGYVDISTSRDRVEMSATIVGVSEAEVIAACEVSNGLFVVVVVIVVVCKGCCEDTGKRP